MSQDTRQAPCLAAQLKHDSRRLLRVRARVNRGTKNAGPVAFRQALQGFEGVLGAFAQKKPPMTPCRATMTRIADATLRFVQVQRSTPVVGLEPPPLLDFIPDSIDRTFS